MVLPPRLPVIIRLDGRAFHTFTRRPAIKETEYQGPWSLRMHQAMTKAAEAVLRDVSGALITYVQSDEITVLVYNANLDSEPWFGNQVQKICSLTASAATAAFNRSFRDLDIPDATFDSRCFVIPLEDVNNNFLWRQRDATTNSIQMLAQHHFSRKQLFGRNSNDQQDMLMLEGINWNDIPTWQKRGWCVCRFREERTSPDGSVHYRTAIRPDLEIPIFSQDCEYVFRSK